MPTTLAPFGAYLAPKVIRDDIVTSYLDAPIVVDARKRD
jgi:hypothetical protein